MMDAQLGRHRLSTNGAGDACGKVPKRSNAKYRYGSSQLQVLLKSERGFDLKNTFSNAWLTVSI